MGRSTYEAADFGEKGTFGAICVVVPLGIVNSVVKIPNDAWGGCEGMRGKTACTIVGYAASHKAMAAEADGSYVVSLGKQFFAFDSAYYVFKRAKRVNKK